MAKKYREGTETKKSLVGEKIYEKFSTKFWLKPELLFKQVHNENVRSSSANSPETTSSLISSKRPKGKSNSEQQLLGKAVKDSSKSSSLTASNPSTVEISNTFRPIIQQFLLFCKMLI
ncbi:unnamed protein product [Rhizophagus irregularis]|uniref:Uncharacterized protein n=1 Tax=Rhizophagus irregularis TaxID=588596 RepID=A0A2I1GJZ7_9GLOM|nr:hypothetical protein RhiirA4_461977 [Rhizophagus irregularis]CAB4441188.1 unnamed protein product [Rhizophagus irregularis]